MTQLSDSEQQIMKIIWKNKGLIFFNQLTLELDKVNKTWKKNTILTFLARLVEKNFLCIEKQGRLNIYKAIISESDYLSYQMKFFFKNVFDGNSKKLVNAMVNNDCISKSDIQELKNYWESDQNE